MSSYINDSHDPWEAIPSLRGAEFSSVTNRLSAYEAKAEVYQYLTDTNTLTDEANRFINDVLPYMGVEGLTYVLERMFWDLREFYTTPKGHYIDHDKYDQLAKLNKDRYLVWACTGQAQMPLVYILEALRKVSLVCRMPD